MAPAESQIVDNPSGWSANTHKHQSMNYLVVVLNYAWRLPLRGLGLHGDSDFLSLLMCEWEEMQEHHHAWAMQHCVAVSE